MAAQDAKEDVESSLRLLYDFTAQMLSFGPVLATKMSFYSTLSLPWGLGAAGAETVKRGVDTDNAEGVATMTACMVKLGLLGSVHDIVVSLCDQDRADAVAAVTASLLTQGEVVVVTRITNALIASGYSNHAATITGELISQGNTQIYDVVKEAGLDMGLLGGDAGASASNVIEGLKDQGAQLLEKITPSGGGDKPTSDQEEGTREDRGSHAEGKPYAEDGTHGKESSQGGERSRAGKQSDKGGGTPDADALFSDWSGAKSDAEEAKKERLL